MTSATSGRRRASEIKSYSHGSWPGFMDGNQALLLDVLLCNMAGKIPEINLPPCFLLLSWFSASLSFSYDLDLVETNQVSSGHLPCLVNLARDHGSLR